MKVPSIIILISIILTSCTSKVVIDTGTSSPKLSGDISLSKKVTFDSSGSIQVTNTDTGALPSRMKSWNIDAIENIKTIDDLAKINPKLIDSPGVNHPRFMELQKDQLLLGLEIAKIQEKNYHTLSDEQINIIQCKEIWGDEMIEKEKQFQKDLLKNNTTTRVMDFRYKVVLEERNKALQTIQSSKECEEFIRSHQKRLQEINTAMKSYYTPEMLEIQKKVDGLRATVYKSEAN